MNNTMKLMLVLVLMSFMGGIFSIINAVDPVNHVSGFQTVVLMFEGDWELYYPDAGATHPYVKAETIKQGEYIVPAFEGNATLRLVHHDLAPETVEVNKTMGPDSVFGILFYRDKAYAREYPSAEVMNAYMHSLSPFSTCDTPPGHDCYTTGDPGCDNYTCCESVCSYDPFCCNSYWDSICVDEAIADSACSLPTDTPTPTFTPTPVVPNDYCSGAIPLSIPALEAGSTVGVNYESPGYISCGTSLTAPGVWYSVVGTGGELMATFCSNGGSATYDTKLHVFCKSCDTDLAHCITGNDDLCGLQSEVRWCSQTGNPYYILVSGFSAATGNFNLWVGEINPVCLSTPIDCVPPTPLITPTPTITPIPLCATKLASKYSGGIKTANAVIVCDGNPAIVYAKDRELTVWGFNNLWAGIIYDATINVTYRTSGSIYDDTYRFEYSLDGSFAAPVSIVPETTDYEGSYVTASYDLGPITYAQLGTLAVRLVIEKIGGGPSDPYSVRWDCSWVDLYGDCRAPWPTDTPRPTDTPKPTNTPVPTFTPIPTSTYTPTPAPWAGFRLCPGLNLISQPFDTPLLDTASELVDTVCSGLADVVWYYDCTTDTFVSWSILDPGSGWTVWPGLPFWVNITGPSECYWVPTGTLPTDIVYELCTGINLVSRPLYSNSLMMASHMLADIPGCQGIWRYKKEVSCLNVPGFDGYFPISTPADNFDLTPGYGYYVTVTSAINWTPPNP